MAVAREPPEDDEPPTTRRLKPDNNTRILASAEFDSPDSETFREANLIVIAHPGNKLLGHRIRLGPGAALEIGRDASCDLSLPDVDSVSRHHALLRHHGRTVTLEDRQSTNGTWLRDRRLDQPVELNSGDRFQVGAVHFKFLHDEDVEHAYHEAIYELAVRDGLTGLFNRRKFQEDGERECTRALRYSRPLCLILFDIDNFKHINDEFGHLRGDAVLTRIAQSVRDAVRREQFLARIGGEEFIVLCEETDTAGAAALAGRMRLGLSELRHADGAEGFQVTCSFGVAAFAPPMNGLSDLLRAADKALYRAKEGGRNQVVVYDPEDPSDA